MAPFFMNNSVPSPMITVVMPVYNAEKYLASAIDSILNQTYEDFEFIIIDDASKDNSWNVAKTFHDPRIILLENEINMGPAVTANLGIQNAKGEFIARLDADDISFRDRFERQITFFNSHPKVGVLGGPFQEITADGIKVGSPRVPLQEPYLIKFWLLFEDVMNNPTIMIRKKVLEGSGGYNPDLRVSEDYELWTRLTAVTEFSNLPDPLIYYRIHSKSASSTQVEKMKRNHMLICQRECAQLTGKKYDESFLMLLFSNEVLKPSQTRSLIALYQDCLNLYIKNEELTPKQKKGLLYTLSWRISYLVKRTYPSFLILDKKLQAYLNNKDLLVNDLVKKH